MQTRYSDFKWFGHLLRCHSPWLVLWALIVIPNVQISAQALPAQAPPDLATVRLLLKKGQYAECVKQAQRAIDDGSFGEEWRVLKLDAELRLGRYDDAGETLAAGLVRYRTSVQLRWLGQQALRYLGQDKEAATMRDEMVTMAQQAPWRYSDPANRVTLGRMFLARGGDPREVLDTFYDPARKELPGFVPAHLAAGDLALATHDYQLAAQSYEKAARSAPEDADAHFGLARAFASSDAEKSEDHLSLVLELNPNHVDARIWRAEQHIDAEQYVAAEVELERALQVNPEHELVWAAKAVLAHLEGDSQHEAFCHRVALGWWDSNPEVEYFIGRKLAQKYRFREAAEHLRRAIAFDANHTPARIELTQTLLRLGEDDEGWELAQQVNQVDQYNVVLHNLMELRDQMRRFRTIESEHFTVRMEAREAAVYGDRVLQLLERAHDSLCEKYDHRLERRVIVEIFDRQQDFAIRTFGLPGGAGFLGVCFGNVITANSPAALSGTLSNWQSVLWHEFCHVVTLQKSKNRMPRWLSEGISVYEERQADPGWGQRMTPQYRQMLLSDELTPVSKLSGAFLRPQSALHLQFAYYESSLVVEFLIERHGFDVLNRILVDLGVGMPINDALARYAGDLNQLDDDFAEFAHARAKALAPKLEFEELELEPGADASVVRKWIEEHPENYWALHLKADALIKATQWQEAREPLKVLMERYPDDRSGRSARLKLAQVHRALGEHEEERKLLVEVAAASDDAVEVYRRLADLARESDDWSDVAEQAERILQVNPLLPAPYRDLATAAEKQQDFGRAATALKALLAMDLSATAETHYRLASLLFQDHQWDAARRHVLLALEEAPRYRDAHRLLLEIVEQRMQGSEKLPKNETPAVDGERGDGS